jgi:hypothetical protein
VAPLAATATLAAATVSNGLPDCDALYGWLILAALAWALGYLAACWIWPFGNCRRCHGTGQRRSPSGRAFRTCRRCDGGGARLRAGRHLINYVRAEYDRRPKP